MSEYQSPFEIHPSVRSPSPELPGPTMVPKTNVEKEDRVARKGFRQLRKEACEKIKTLGAPRDPDNLNKSVVDSLMRISMRYPSEKTRERINILHDKMKNTFASMPDEALEWLRGGSAKVARGGFNSVEDLKAFLHADPSKLEPSALVTGLETILAAMGYRSIHADWVMEPFAPETPAQEKMDRLIKELVVPHRVPAIGKERYPDRADDSIESKPQFKSEEYSLVMGLRRPQLSEASGAEEAVVHERLDERRFREILGWTAVAKASGVDIRAHTSGTCPLEVAAVAGFLDDEEWFHNDKEAAAFLASLTIPSFHRGDFHSVAETYAGIHHFLHERAEKAGKSSEKMKAAISPRDALKGALSALQKTIKKELRHDFGAASSEVILNAKKIKYVPSRSGGSGVGKEDYLQY